jgi:Cupin-like domain
MPPPEDFQTFMKEYKYSEIIDEFPDKEKYPLYYEASPHEYTIKPGEKLFIPAGWFHVVYSEDVDKETGLNFALNYWYDPVNGWKDGQPSTLLPRIEKHSIPRLDPNVVFGDEPIRVIHTRLNGLFPSDRIFQRFPGKCAVDFITFREFYEAKNPNMYVIQAPSEKFRKYMPEYPTPSTIMAAWINYGKARCLIHYDEYDNWLCQLQGTKRVVLFPHEDRDKLYMFNPVPIGVINTIKTIENSPMYYIAKSTFDLTRDIRNVYAEEMMKYKKFKLDIINGSKIFPDILPQNFKEVTINGHYEKHQMYPLTMIFVKEGTAYIVFYGRDKIVRLRKGEFIIFPSHFTYPYEVTGINLKIIVPE